MSLKITNKREQVKTQLIIGTKLNPSDQAFICFIKHFIM